MSMLLPVIAAILCGMAPARAVLAQDPATEAAPPPLPASGPAPIEIRLSGGVYLPRLVGNTKLGPSPAAQDLDFRSDIDLNESRTIPLVEVLLVKNQLWEVQVSGFEYETSRTGIFEDTSDYGSLSLAPGDTYRGEFRMTAIGAEVSRRQWRAYEKDTDGVDLYFSPTVGARLFDIRQVIEEVGVGREEYRADYLHAYVGIQMDMHWRSKATISWLERYEIEAGIFAGPALGADWGYGWAIKASMSLYFSEDVSFLFGYRLYELILEDGEYEISGGLQGLFIGGTIRF